MMKTRSPLSTFLAALFFFVLLPLMPGCAGGCGDEPSSSKDSSAQGGGPGAGEPSKGGGGGAQKVGSRFDTSGKKSTSTALGQLGETEEQSRESARTLKKVSPAEFKNTVLRTGTTAFLMVSGANCEDCDTILPVLATLTPQFRDSFQFFQFDGDAVGASGMLPAGMSLTPLPGFAMYRDGKVTSLLQGLPFPMQVGPDGKPRESKEQFQARLMRWFRDALTTKNLNFSKSMQKAPAAKD